MLPENMQGVTFFYFVKNEIVDEISFLNFV